MDRYDKIKNLLSEKRWIHTLAVIDMAKKLAGLYGISEADAETAALLHDMCKDFSADKMNGYVTEYGLGKRYLDNNNLAHAKVAACLARDQFHVSDDVYHAVCYHTTGRAGMSPLEKLIYLSDAIAEGRDYSTLEMLRTLAYQDLDAACLELLKQSVEYIKEKNLPLHEDTLHAIRDLKIQLGEDMDYRELSIDFAKIIDDKKGQDIVIIDISQSSSFADYFVIATGNTDRQIKTICDEIEEKMEARGIFVKNIEGKQNPQWILMDYGDIIVNLFLPELRERYNLEKIWGDCTFIDVDFE